MSNGVSGRLWKVSVVATSVSAIATAFIAWAYFTQTGIMEDTLHFMQMGHVPEIRMHLHPDLDKESTVEYVPTDEGGQRWKLPYFLINLGDLPIHELRYHHLVSTNEIEECPAISVFNVHPVGSIVWPKDILTCGYDPLLRQQAIDTFKAGKCYYRHFWTNYSDDLERSYTYYATWKICEYTEREPLDFALVSYRRLNAGKN